MKLFLMRHGEAASARPDRDRALTAFGERTSVEMASHLKYQNLHTVISSDYLRAKQTASAVAGQISFEREIEEFEYFVPDADPHVAFKYLCELISQRKTEALLLVTHLPIISFLASLALDATLSQEYAVQPSTIIILESEEPALGTFRLLAIKTP